MAIQDEKKIMNAGPVIFALRTLADMLESGEYKYLSGAINIEIDSHLASVPDGPLMKSVPDAPPCVIINSDLILRRSSTIHIEAAQD